MDDSNACEDKLDVLREQFATRLPGRFDEISTAFSAWKAQPDNDDLLKVLLTCVHKLAGAAGTFGFRAIGNVASRVEHTLETGFRNQAPRAQLVETLGREVQTLIQCEISSTQPYASFETPLGPHGETSRERLVFISPRTDETAQIEESLVHYGFKVVFANPSDARETMEETSGLPLILDQDAVTVMNEDIGTLAKTHPVIAISADGSLEQRLAAVRAGARSFLKKPFSASELLDRIDQIAPQQPRSPFRVMIIDDQEETLEYLKTLLTSQGMLVKCIDDPLLALETFEHFSPEIVVTDQHMPGCTGTELANIFRQIPQYTALPIIILSGDKSHTTHLSAFSEGADDFLSKDVQPDLLLKAISTRAERFRQLSSLLMRDGLTGLYNHTSIQKQLDHEIKRAQRTSGSLSYMILDIDYFKSINDRFGHPVGDRVIQSLSRLLRRSIRSSDLIGRIGGEEFGIIMPEARAEDIVSSMDKIRETFANMTHEADGEQFTATFSCGIADFPTHATTKSLIKAADNAMYAAKQAGRNQVLTA